MLSMLKDTRNISGCGTEIPLVSWQDKGQLCPPDIQATDGHRNLWVVIYKAFGKTKSCRLLKQKGKREKMKKRKTLNHIHPHPKRTVFACRRGI